MQSFGTTVISKTKNVHKIVSVLGIENMPISNLRHVLGKQVRHQPTNSIKWPCLGRTHVYA